MLLLNIFLFSLAVFRGLANSDAEEVNSIVPRNHVESPITTAPAPTINNVLARTETVVSTTSLIRKPVYNNYAMSCVGDRQITKNCQGHPHYYYCDGNGVLRRQKGGRADDMYCDWCDCINLMPKSNCLLNLHSGTYSCSNGISGREPGDSSNTGDDLIVRDVQVDTNGSRQSSDLIPEATFDEVTSPEHHEVLDTMPETIVNECQPEEKLEDLETRAVTLTETPRKSGTIIHVEERQAKSGAESAGEKSDQDKSSSASRASSEALTYQFLPALVVVVVGLLLV